MISKILVATDGSRTASKAVRYAVELAKQAGASITVVSVIDKASFLTGAVPAAATPTHIIEPVEDYMRQAAEGYVGKAEEFCVKNNVRFRKIIRTGHPVEEIVREAKRSKVDIIVIGSQGRSAFTAAVLGSVSLGVIHKSSNIPVLLVKK
jgi:nucleotide-binding universal stress UspA family protein